MPERFHSRSFRFALDVVRLLRVIAHQEHQDGVPRHLLYQMLRAGTSIGANLEEARSAYSRRDLAAKYSIAAKEARECHYWLRLIAADRPELLTHIAPLLSECDQLIAMLTATIRKLKTSATCEV